MVLAPAFNIIYRKPEGLYQAKRVCLHTSWDTAVKTSRQPSPFGKQVTPFSEKGVTCCELVITYL